MYCMKRNYALFCQVEEKTAGIVAAYLGEEVGGNDDVDEYEEEVELARHLNM